jgi:hypothetical protein
MRQQWLGLLALVGLWVGFPLWQLLHPKPQPLGIPTKANFDRIEDGMTAEEVVAILGPPEPPPRYPLDHVRHAWEGDGYLFIVDYSLHSPRVSSKAEWPPESFRERLRRWLPWSERVFASK